MSLGRIFLDYIRDMLDNAEKAVGFVEEMDSEEFFRDEKTH
jgi:uncharacterized protein with HEPN domain